MNKMIENGEMKCFHMLNEKLSFLNDLPKDFCIKSGQEINFVTNIYPISFTNDTPPKLYQYKVNVNPDPENSKTASTLICSTLFPEGNPSEWDSLVYLDQDHTIISSHNDLAKNEISHVDKQGTNYEIHISLEKEINLQNNISDFSQIVNKIIYRCFTKLGFSSLDENFINNTDYTDVDHLRLVGGFYPRPDFFSNNLCLVLDTASRIDRKGTLYDILISGVSNVARRQSIEESLNKMIYVTRHLSHQQTVRILKVRWNSKAQTEPINDHSKITIADYFMSQYNFFSKPDDPTVDVMCNGKVDSLPSSALSQIGITETERADSALMSTVRDALFLDPGNRKQKLESIIISLKNDEQTVPLLKNFGLSIGDPLVIKGHVLESPELYARSKEPPQKFIHFKPNSQMIDDVTKIYTAVPSNIKSVPLIIAPESYQSQVRDIFIRRFKKIATDVDLSFYDPETRYLSNFGYNSIRGEIFNYIRKNGVPSFIIFICPEKNQQRYDYLNQLLITSLGIPSHFILADSIFNGVIGVDDLLIDMAFQITAKTGGIPYYVPLPLSRTLIIGVAGYKNKTENNGQITICMSASIDQTCARFYSDTLVLNSNECIPDSNIAQFVKSAKEKFKDIVNEIPSGLIVYRLLSDTELGDQNSKNYRSFEDELIQIAKSELPSFKNAFNSKPKSTKQNSFVFIAVHKSSTIRLFMNNEDKVENPPPGTVVFDQSSGLADFYLVSNCTQFGTATPARYIILDHSPQDSWNDENIAQLTYNLSYNYYCFPSDSTQDKFVGDEGALRLLPSPLTNSLKIATFSHQHLNDLQPCQIMKEKIVTFV